MLNINNSAVIWPSAGTGARRQRAQRSAMAVLASCVAIEKLVSALAEGSITAPDMTGVSQKELRYAPHYVPGKGHSKVKTVPYTLRWIEKALINNGQQSRYLRVAMALLVGCERGYADDNTFTNIAMLRPQYDIATLLRELRRKDKWYETIHGGALAMGEEK